MRYCVTPAGICPRRLLFEINDGIVSSITFEGGCDGNLQAISRLCEGRRVEDIIPLLKGISCGGGPTSCPDQLARALRASISSGVGE